MDNNLNIDELLLVREYFSQEIRTATALIVATATVMHHGFIDDIDSASESIAEAGYFLDIFEAGMNLCFDFVLGKEISQSKGTLSPSKVIQHSITKLACTLDDNNSKIQSDLSNFEFVTNSYVVKLITEIIVCEELKQHGHSYTISNNDNEYTLSKNHASEQVPIIYPTLQKMLATLGIDFNYNTTSITLRFPA